MTAPAAPASQGLETVRASRQGDIRHGLVAGGTNILAILAGLSEAAFHPLAAHLFGPAIYGLYRWAVSSVEPLLRLSPLGTDLALLRYVASHHAAGEIDFERSSVRTALWATAVTGVLFGLATYLFAERLAHFQGRPESAAALRLLAPAIPFTALVAVLVYATMAAKTTKYNLVVRGIGQPVTLLVVSTAAGLLVPTLTALCISHLVAVSITLALAAWALNRVYGRNGDRAPARFEGAAIDRPRPAWLHADMIRFSIPLGFSEFLNSVLQRTDVILVAFYAGAETLGVYAGAEALSRVVSNARYAFDPVASPVLAEALQQNDVDRLRYNLKLMTRWTVLLTVPLMAGMVVLRAELLSLFPAQFAAAGTSLVILLAGHLVNGCLGLTGWVIVMSGRSTLTLVNNLAAAISNVVLCVVLIPRFGMPGAAISASSSVALLQGLQVAEAAWFYRALPFSPGFFKAMVAGAGAALVAAVLVPPFGAHAAWRFVARAGTIAACYGVLVWLLGLASEEREALRQLAARMRR